jgi:hypothetical protein
LLQRAGDSRALLSDTVFYCGRAGLAGENPDSVPYNNQRRSSVKKTAGPSEYYRQQEALENNKKRVDK